LVLAKPGIQGLFILNETAAFLYSLVCQHLPFDSLVDRFCETYGISRGQAASDIAATLDFWQTRLLDALDSPPIRPSVPAAPAAFAFSADYKLNGSVIRVAIEDSALAAEICPRLESIQARNFHHPDLTFQIWRENGRVLLAHDGVLLASEEIPNAVRAILLQEMARRTERGRNWLAILHAGACALDGGGVLLFAGPSQAGKTTLCAALMASGFTFYGDDSAAIGEDGAVSPMPFRLMIREGSWQVLHSRFPALLSSPSTEHCGQLVRFLSPPPGQIATAPGAANALLFVAYRPGEKTCVRPLLPFERLLKVRESGFWVQHDRGSIGALLAWLERLPAYEFTYSDLDEAIAEIRKLARNRP
jgi:hypothetical protein